MIDVNKKLGVWTTIELYSLWAIFCVAMTAAIVQFNTTLQFLSLVWLQSDYRPLYWNSYTIGGLARLYVLILGIVWVFLLSWSEYKLRQSAKFKKLRPVAGRMIGFALLTLLISWGVLWVWTL